MVEAQALSRIHRMGQTRHVFTTRYIVNNSIEKVISVHFPKRQIISFRLVQANSGIVQQVCSRGSTIETKAGQTIVGPGESNSVGNSRGKNPGNTN